MGFRSTSQDFTRAVYSFGMQHRCVLVVVGRHTLAKSLLWWWGLCGGCQGVHLLRRTDVTEEGFVPVLVSHWQITNWCYWQLDVTKFCLDGEWGVIPRVSSQRISPLCVFVLEEELVVGQPANCFPKWPCSLKLSKHPMHPCPMLLFLAGKAHEAVFLGRVCPVLHVRLLLKDINPCL